VLTYNGVDTTTIEGFVDADLIADFTILVTGDHDDFSNFI
jgi:hypothetical protein